MNEGIYYLRVNEQVDGPYTIGQIYDLWAARKINSQTPFARFEEMDKWQPLSELTLRISAPKSASQKATAPETNPLQSQRPKPPANRKPEDYFPTLPQGSEPRSLPGKRSSRPYTGPLPRIVFSLEFSIGLSLVIGLLSIIYFLFFFSTSTDVRAIYDAFIATKQSGVLAGIALILLSGFLSIAREVRKLQAALRSKPELKSERRLLDS